MSDKTTPYNVYALSLKDYSRRLMAENLSKDGADLFVTMAVMRRGVEEEIFIAEPATEQS